MSAFDLTDRVDSVCLLMETALNLLTLSQAGLSERDESDRLLNGVSASNDLAISYLENARSELIGIGSEIVQNGLRR